MNSGIRCGIRPCVGFSEARPQWPAGQRTEPAISDPTDRNPIPAASEAPAPAEEPPAEDLPVEDPPTEEPPVEEPPAEDPPAEAPPVEVPVEDPPLEEPPVEEIPVEDPPAEELPQEHIMQFFAFAHLPSHLQAISVPFAGLANRIVDTKKPVLKLHGRILCMVSYLLSRCDYE